MGKRERLLHRIRFTEQKIARLLTLVETLTYQQRQPLPPFRFHAGEECLVAPNVDDEKWPAVEPGDCWSKQGQNLTLRTAFRVPADWQPPVALFLPIGDAHQFVHPEALAYIDGYAYQGINARHQEILLPARWCDGEVHILALCGWAGTGNVPILMGRPEIVQIHQPTPDFVPAVKSRIQEEGG
jgi:alpha-mannosidase